MRGTKGADFEAPGQVRRGGGVGVACGCLGGGGASRDDYKDRYIVIKGPFCFVFDNENASAPCYAIRLHNISVDKEASKKNPKIVELRDNVDGSFILTLEAAEKATECAKTVRVMASIAETEEVRKQLGHGHLLNKRSSVRFAETVATRKAKDQPDAPITSNEILSNMQATNPQAFLPS